MDATALKKSGDTISLESINYAIGLARNRHNDLSFCNLLANQGSLLIRMGDHLSALESYKQASLIIG